MNLIDKDALVAEIEKRIKSTNNDVKIGEIESLTISKALNSLISFIDTLEVKDIDLEEELDEWMKYGPHTSYPWCTIPDAIEITARHFFEFGFKAQKGE